VKSANVKRSHTSAVTNHKAQHQLPK